MKNEISGLQLPRVHWASHCQSPATGEKYEDTTREINLLLVHEGEVKTQVGNALLRAGVDEVLIYPHKTRVHEEMRGHTRYLRLFFVTGSASFDETPRLIALPQDDMATRWMKDVCDLHAMSDMNRDLTGPLLEAILVRLRQIEQRHTTEKTFHPGVVRAVQYLQENMARPVSLTELARHAHLSAGHLREVFHQQVGSTPLQYQRDLRMQRALPLLEQPHLSLTQIAHACGFPDPEYFARRFRLYHQVPPGELRRRKAKPKN